MSAKERINLLRNQVASMKTSLTQIEEINRCSEEYNRQLEEVNKLVADLSNYSLILNRLLKTARNEESKYRDSRNAYLESYCSEYIHFIFPDSNYICQIDTPQKRGVNNTKLTIRDELGYPSNPKLFLSGLMKQLVSCSAIIAVTELMGYNTFFLDEAFGNASIDNKPLVGQLLGKVLERDFTIFLISQDPGLYRDLPRREISLYYKDNLIDKEVTDYEF